MWRRRQGRVWVYDPTASTRPRPRVVVTAAVLADLGGGAPHGDIAHRGRPGRRRASLTDGDFWYATATKLLAPLLMAAATSGRHDGRRRALGGRPGGRGGLRRARVPSEPRAALQAMRAAWGRDERQRSAVYTTAETVIEVFADPAVAASDSSGSGASLEDRVDPVRSARRERHPVPVCARARPAATAPTLRHARDPGRRGRLRACRAPGRSHSTRPCSSSSTRPPTWPRWPSSTCWRRRQPATACSSSRCGRTWPSCTARYGHSGRQRGEQPPGEGLPVGDRRPGHAWSTPARSSVRPSIRSWTTTVDGSGATSLTDAPSLRRLAPADSLRRIPPGDAVVVSGHLAPIRLRLRSWHDDRTLRARAQSEADAPAARWWARRSMGTVGP